MGYRNARNHWQSLERYVGGPPRSSNKLHGKVFQQTFSNLAASQQSKERPQTH
jgi:hypothetical protein